MAVLVLIVFVGGAWLWAYRTTPSASAITGELNAIPVNVTSEQLIRDGYIDLTKKPDSRVYGLRRKERHYRGQALH